MDVTFSSILKIKNIIPPEDEPKPGFWKVLFNADSGALIDFILYINCDTCSYVVGDLYTTERGEKGGWKLQRLCEEAQPNRQGAIIIPFPSERVRR